MIQKFYRRFLWIELLVFLGIWNEVIDMYDLGRTVGFIGVGVLVLMTAYDYYRGLK